MKRTDRRDCRRHQPCSGDRSSCGRGPSRKLRGSGPHRRATSGRTRRRGQTAPDSEPWRFWALHLSGPRRIRIHPGRVLRMDRRNGPRLNDAWLRSVAMRRNQGVQGRHWLPCGLRRVVLQRLRNASTSMRRAVAGRHRTLADPWSGSDINVAILAKRSPTESD